MEIERELRRRILTGCYGPGQRIPPERQLEEEFGCSRLTIAKALAPLVAEGLITRHRGRGSFVADLRQAGKDAGASALPNGGRSPARGNVVKYISPGHDQGGRSSRDDVLSGLHDVLDGAGYHVSIDFYSDLDQHLRCLEKVDDPQIAGLVLWPTPHERTVETVSEVVARGLPIVLIDTYLPELDCDYAVTDNIEGAAMMVRHLARMGHRRIAYVTAPVDRTSLLDRLSGFMRGMVAAGLPVDSRSVVHLESPDLIAGRQPDRAALERVADSLFAGPDRPTAVFASNDRLALPLVSVLQERGVMVPADITVAGYDGIEAGEFSSVPLTTVKQDFYQMARIAARILLERFDGRIEPLRYHWQIKPQLTLRSSSSAPKPAAAPLAVTA